MSCQVKPADYFGDLYYHLGDTSIVLKEVNIWQAGDATELEIADTRVKSGIYQSVENEISSIISQVNATQLIAVFLDKTLTGNYTFSQANIAAVSRFSPMGKGIEHNFYYYDENRFKPLPEVHGKVNIITTNALHALAQTVRPARNPIRSILLIADADHFNINQKGHKDHLQWKVKNYLPEKNR